MQYTPVLTLIAFLHVPDMWTFLPPGIALGQATGSWGGVGGGGGGQLEEQQWKEKELIVEGKQMHSKRWEGYKPGKDMPYTDMGQPDWPALPGTDVAFGIAQPHDQVRP